MSRVRSPFLVLITASLISLFPALILLDWLVDGAVIGTSPLQKRVRTGSHVVELALAGYEPFREVVDVPSAGLSFLSNVGPAFELPTNTSISPSLSKSSTANPLQP